MTSPNPEVPKVAPYGVYDVGGNEGFSQTHGP